MNTPVRDEMLTVAYTVFNQLWRDREKVNSVDDFAVFIREMADEAIRLMSVYPNSRSMLYVKFRDMSAVCLRAAEFTLEDSTQYCDYSGCRNRLTEVAIAHGKKYCPKHQIDIRKRY